MKRGILNLGLLLSLGLILMPGCEKKDKDEPGKTQGQDSTTNTAAELNIRWVTVEGGSFMMGDPQGYDNEKPQHRVEVSGFRMSATEVTNAQYNEFLKAMKAKGGEAWNRVAESGANFPRLDTRFTGDNQPVVRVSWEDAMAFCEWVGNGVTLPTEAQWEYACRAGSTGRFCFGEDEAQLDEYAWHMGNAKQVTHAVGGKKPNAWGLYDMHGNVFEWCADWNSDDYYKVSPLKDPTGPDSGYFRVNRGGCYFIGDCRSAYRPLIGDLPTHQSTTLGFRLVAPLP